MSEQHTVSGLLGVTPVVAFFSNISPILTALSTLAALAWFGVLFYDRFINHRKGPTP